MYKSYGKVEALCGISLKIGGGVWGLIGPNGAGKTTFIKLVLGLLRPTAGEIRAFGFSCWEDSLEVRKRIGVLHERPSYPNEMEALRYLTLVARFYGIKKPDKRAKNALKLVGLIKFSNRRICTLSAGMVQRLGLAQAIVHEPELIILDEPTASLDVLARMEFLERVRRMSEEGVNFLISSHILSELQAVCDHVALISSGRILRVGEVRNLLKEFSKGFHVVESSNPMALTKLLREMGYEAWVDRGITHVKSQNAAVLARDVASICMEEGIDLISLRASISSLEEVFRRLMSFEGDD
ncbi:MAG TPA: ABC transporter ATP-binding protein [Candidatus Korarchaeota archaeon]|nr:ABC transporter ATP-binding protein [Candidatus Korarchaeota archaeon]